MGAIGGLLGLAGGAAGTGFDKPQTAPLLQGVTEGQTQEAYNQNQRALVEQESLMRALAAAGGVSKQEGVYNELGGLAGNLQNVAAGQGPNPAQAMLNQATGANIANQAALMAGQRGVGANTGLLARQAAQQGGALQQQAVGQGATMQANQSLGAMQQLANVLQQRGGIANQQVANQIGATGAFTGANQAQQGQLLNAMGQLNQARVGTQSSVNAGNAALANTTMQGTQGLLGGAMNAGAAMFADGGPVAPQAPQGPQSSFGQFVNRVHEPTPVAIETAPTPGANAGADQLNKGMSSLGKKPAAPGALSQQIASTPAPTMPAFGASEGGMVDVMLSPGEKVVPPGKVQEAAGGNVQARTVPGQAKVSGDSYKNDTFKTKLPAGSVVVPRTKAKNKKSSAEFVRKTLARRGKK